MSSGVFTYARPQAVTRALIGELLDAGQIRTLAAAEDLAGAIRVLRGTVYGQWLEGPAAETLLGAEQALDRSLLDAFRRIRDSLNGPAEALVVGMARKLELLNLLAVLRTLVRGRDPQEAAPLWVDLGEMATLPKEELLRARDVFEVTRLLEGTPYGPALHIAMDRYRRERTLFPLEMALQLGYYRYLWSLAAGLAQGDRPPALRLLGLRYDLLNIEWVIRFRLLYRMPSEELFNYTLPHGRLLNARILRRMAAANSLAEIVTALPSSYQRLLSGLGGQLDESWRIGVALGRALYEGARAELFGYPFRITLQIVYLWLKEAEVNDVKTILEAKQYRRPAEAIAPLLVTVRG